MNRELINIGPITIYWYSVMILTGILIGMYFALKEAKKVGLKDYINDLLFYLIIFGIIGARLYYVIFEFDNYKYDLLSIFKIWEGGLAIYGGIIGGLIAVIIYAKKNKVAIIKTTDILVPSLIIAQSIGRWGNFFNQEAHGVASTLTYLQKIHIPKFIINGMYIDGVYYHPTFLYESIWCLLGFIVLLLIRKITNRKIGIVTWSYFIWYGFGRFFIEGIRTDSLYLGNIRISQMVSLILVLIGVIGIIINIINNRKEVLKK